MMEAQGFSTIAGNLFVGLTENNRFLAPLSGQFADAGVELFALDQDFPTAQGTCNPDGLAISNKLGGTIVAEWTSQACNDGKTGQISRYVAATVDELQSNAGVPRTALGAKATWVIVPPERWHTYAALTNLVGDIAFSTLALPGLGAELKYRGGKVSNSGLASLVQQTRTFLRIPRGYIPFNLDDLSIPSLAAPVIQQIVSYAVRGKVTFSLEELCTDLLPVWPKLSVTRRKGVKSAVKGVVNKLVKKKYIERWLSRQSQEPPKWKFAIDDPYKLQRMTKRIKDVFELFVIESAGVDTTPGLFDHLEN